MGYRRHYSGDPRWITARFNSECSNKDCHNPIKKGEEVFYYPNGKKALCASRCSRPASDEFSWSAAAEDGLI